MQFQSDIEESPIEKTTDLSDRSIHAKRESRREFSADKNSVSVWIVRFRQQQKALMFIATETLTKLMLFVFFFFPSIRVYTKEDPLQLRLSPGTIAPTPPPSSPQIELLRQQYAYLLANSTNTGHASYLHPSTYDCLMAQKVLAQQFLDNYRALLEQQQQTGYPVVEGRYFVVAGNDDDRLPSV